MRRGIALVAALGVMVLIALLLAGAVAASTLAWRSARLTHTDATVTAAADYALGGVIADPSTIQLADLPFGQTLTLATSVPLPGVQVNMAATRLRGSLAWIVADAQVPGLDQGHRRLGLLARWPAPGAMPAAGIIARGNVRLGSGAAFTADPGGDADCRTAAIARIIIAPGAASSSTDSVPTTVDPLAADSSTYYLRSSQLAAFDTAGNFLHVRRDTAIGTGSFTGVAVFDGAVTISGAFSLNGILVVRGPLDATRGSLSVTGALLAFGTASAGQFGADLGPAAIRWSPCAIAAAFRHAVPLRPVRQRSWAELF